LKIAWWGPQGLKPGEPKRRGVSWIGLGDGWDRLEVVKGAWLRGVRKGKEGGGALG